MTKEEFAATVDFAVLQPYLHSDDILNACECAKEKQFASVCVSPYWVMKAHEFLKDSSVKTCAVIDYPRGLSITSARIAEVQAVHSLGADEVDIMVPVGAIVDGDITDAYDDLLLVVAQAHNLGMVAKVIVEQTLLDHFISQGVVEVAIKAKADYIKTSTGFHEDKVTPNDVAFLVKLVDGRAQVKASGGIVQLSDALLMLKAGASRLGVSDPCSLLRQWDKWRQLVPTMFK